MRKGNKVALIAGACALTASLLFAAVGCSPSEPKASPADTGTPAASQKADAAPAQAPTQATAATGKNVTNDSGYFPDNLINTEFLNTGNRGCDSCHDDIYALVENLSPDYRHIWTYQPGYGQKARIDDCLTCHRLHAARVGPYLGDLLHGYHYNNEQFVNEMNGNCWSCHAINPDSEPILGGSADDEHFVLYDEFKYSPQLGGYPGGNDAGVIRWLDSRGWDGGHITEISLDANMGLDVELSQPVLEESDMFIVDNWKAYDGPASTTPVDMDTWTLTITGAKETRSFTYEELLAMPQESVMVTQECYSAMPGSVFVGNFEAEGVPISYLFELCGGVPDDVNAARFTGHDGYRWNGVQWIDLLLRQDALIGLKMWGHDLTEDQGYPATLVIPGKPGAGWVKWLEDIELFYIDEEEPYDPEVQGFDYRDDLRIFANPVTGHPVSSTLFWMNDGDTFSMADGPIHFQGYSWVWATEGRTLDTVSFSFDYGVTWDTVKVPENFDPNQWTVWDFDWTPPAPGTYIFKVKAADNTGYEQHWEDSTIIRVTE